MKSLDPVKSRLLPSREGMEFGEFSPGEILIAAERRGMVHSRSRLKEQAMQRGPEKEAANAPMACQEW